MFDWLFPQPKQDPASAMNRLLHRLIEEIAKMSDNFNALVAQVDASNAIAAEAVTAVTTLVATVSTHSAQIADLTAQLATAHAAPVEDVAAIDALTAKLKAASDALSAALPHA
jgi:ABC-type transporter Mla subunit MlaD